MFSDSAIDVPGIIQFNAGKKCFNRFGTVYLEGLFCSTVYTVDVFCSNVYLDDCFFYTYSMNSIRIHGKSVIHRCNITKFKDRTVDGESNTVRQLAHMQG